jgi:hypothetical protein
MYQMKDAFEEAIKKRAEKAKANPSVNIKIEVENAEDEDKATGLAPSKLPPEAPAAKAKPAAAEEVAEELPVAEEVVEELPAEQSDDDATMEMLAKRASDGASDRKPTTLGERAAADFLKRKK